MIFGLHLKSLSLHQMTPLHVAVQKGHLEIVRCLVNAETAAISIKDNNGVNTLHCGGFVYTLSLSFYSCQLRPGSGNNLLCSKLI